MADAHSFAQEEYESLISQGFLNQTHAFEYVTACGKSYMTKKIATHIFGNICPVKRPL